MKIPYKSLTDEELNLISEVIYRDDLLGFEKRIYKVFDGTIMISLIGHLKNNDEINIVTPLKFKALGYNTIYEI